MNIDATLAASDRRMRTYAWLAAQPEPLTRAEALRRRLGASHVSLAADGHAALVMFKDWSQCFLAREHIDGSDEALRDVIARESFHGFGDLFCVHEPLPDLTDEQLASVDVEAFFREMRS